MTDESGLRQRGAAAATSSKTVDRYGTAGPKPEDRPAPVYTKGGGLTLGKLFRFQFAAITPFVGVFVALPRMMQLRRLAPLKVCGRDVDTWTSCGTGGGGFTAVHELPYYLFAIWVSVQFLYNFICTAVIDPGTIPEEEMSDLPHDEDGHYKVILAGGEDSGLRWLPRWCKYSNVFKPPQCHYSRSGGCLVLRMDHYCWVTGSVIGIRNHGHFILMTFFAWVGLIHALTMSAIALYSVQPLISSVSFKISKNLMDGIGDMTMFDMMFELVPLRILINMLGYQIVLLVAVTSFAMCCLIPLCYHNYVALSGKTVLAKQAPKQARDRVFIDEECDPIWILPGGISKGGLFATLHQLLGSGYLMRLLVPCRGNVDVLAEIRPELNPGTSVRLMKMVENMRKELAEKKQKEKEENGT